MIETLREDWRATLAVVSGGHFLSHFYFLALPPLFPLLRGEFGLNNTQLGLVVSVLTLGGLLQAPVGNVVDRVGAKWIFVAGVGATAGGIALIGVGPTYPAVLALAAVAGIGQSAFHPADYAIVDAVTDPGVQGRAFSVHTFSGFAGFAAAPVVVGTLGFAVGWRGALLVVGGAGVLYAGFAAVALVPTGPDRVDGADGSDRGTDAGRDGDADREGSSDGSGAAGSLLAAFRRPGLLAMVGFFTLMAFAGKGVQTFTSVLAVNAFGLEESIGNTLLTVYFALGALGILAGGVLADRYPPSRVIAVSLLVGATALLATLAGLVPAGAAPLLAVFGLVGFFVSLVNPSRDRLVSDLSASGSMGQSFGIVFTGGTVGGLVGPVLLGAVADGVSVRTSFVLVGAFFLAAGTLAFSLGRGWLTPGRATTSAEGD
jgi:MFS family permease